MLNAPDNDKVKSSTTVNNVRHLAVVRQLLRKEYCKICGQELTEIRGRYPKQPRRKVCACCATEKLEWLEEQNNVGAKCSNNA